VSEQRIAYAERTVPQTSYAIQYGRTGKPHEESGTRYIFHYSAVF
jgi:hypothetical protein